MKHQQNLLIQFLKHGERWACNMAELDRDNRFFDYKAPVVPIVDEQTKIAGARAAAAVGPTPADVARAASKASWTADDEPYYTAKVGDTGLTQAQIDTRASAVDVSKSINENYSGLGITSTVDPKTGKITTKKNDVPITNTSPSSPLYGAVFTSANTATTDSNVSNEKRDAFALIKQTLQGYGFTDTELSQLFNYIEKALLDPKIGPNQMILDLRALPVYKARFAGNETRIKMGLNALSEANYIEQENSYAQYLRAGGVSKLGNRATYAKLIGGAVSPTEVGKRVNMAVDRVTTADPAIMKQIYKYNPNISQQDLVSYFLDPENTLPELEKKVTMGEIGAVATQQDLDAGFGRIENLQQYGVTRAQAVAGYGNIGQVLPTAEKLGDVYSESGITYDQATGESEFFKSNASAMDKRNRLASMERGSFGGSAGNAPGAYSTGYLRKPSAAGLI